VMAVRGHSNGLALITGQVSRSIYDNATLPFIGNNKVADEVFKPPGTGLDSAPQL
jgi:hypothetical protein